MSLRANLIFVIVLGAGILWFAFKDGFIGGGGAGAYRTKNPVNFWLGVSITAACWLMCLVLLILNLAGVVRS